MDHTAFDRLARLIASHSTRRAALGALVGAVLAVTSPRPAEGKRRGRRRDRKRSNGKSSRRDRGRRLRAQVLPARCCSTNPCVPGPGANLGKCCFEDANLAGQNFKGANLGRAVLTGAILTNANFKGANLGNACLVDANLTGALINNSTNLGGAIFCRTTMPDGSINNSGCNQDSACCSTCGGEGEPCCEGDVCDADLACNDTGICVPCGASGELCCADDVCDAVDLVCDSGLCVPCGDLNDPCCADAICNADNLVCNAQTGQCDCVQPGQCGGCTPLTCLSLGRQCGFAPDGCGAVLNCGACPAGQTCGPPAGQCSA